MNPNLDKLQPYPFERLAALLTDITPSAGMSYIPLSIGEPKHKTADFLVDFLSDKTRLISGLGAYPPTKGSDELRTSIANFINKRFNLSAAPIDAAHQVLPVNGTREALFAFAQAITDGHRSDALTAMPNPFYQIYEGAALLSGSTPYFLNCNSETNFIPDFTAVSADVWQRCQLIYICSPGNPSGAVMDVTQLQSLIQLAMEYDFIIASDECYSEIYQDEDNPPPGLLEAAHLMGHDNFENCIVFNSLSKRSNLPGLRSGFVAGDGTLIKKFLLYRTYHGSAMSQHHQELSSLAWSDEQHVVENRRLYREKFELVKDILKDVWPVKTPDASFYLWPETPIDDQVFTRALLKHCNIKVVPGSLLSRDTPDGNPGKQRVRLALVADIATCRDAALRIKKFMLEKQYLLPN